MAAGNEVHLLYRSLLMGKLISMSIPLLRLMLNRNIHLVAIWKYCIYLTIQHVQL